MRGIQVDTDKLLSILEQITGAFVDRLAEVLDNNLKASDEKKEENSSEDSKQVSPQ